MMRGMYTCLDEGDQHDDSRCDGSTWTDWAWTSYGLVEGRICGVCKAWQFRFVAQDDDGNWQIIPDPRPDTQHRSVA